MGEEHELSDFLRHPLWGINRMLDFMEYWLKMGSTLPHFLLLRYEDMHRAAAGELRRVMDFMGFEDLEDDLIDTAVAYAQIDNLRKLAVSHFQKETFTPENPQDRDSHKFRKGEIGGYKTYLDNIDIAWFDREIEKYPHTADLYAKNFSENK